MWCGREEAAAHILTDHLGIELLAEEALKLGESVRRAAQSIDDRTKAKEKAASAKRSRMIKAAEKDAAREARLERELQQLNSETEAACVHLRAEHVRLVRSLPLLELDEDAERPVAQAWSTNPGPHIHTYTYTHI